jgi:hypothetical protein
VLPGIGGIHASTVCDRWVPGIRAPNRHDPPPRSWRCGKENTTKGRIAPAVRRGGHKLLTAITAGLY